MIDVEHLSFDEVGGCFDGEGGLAYSGVPVEDEDVVLVVLEVVHETV